MDDYLIWTHLWSYRILKWFLGGGLLITSFHLIKTFLRVYFKETKRRQNAQKRHKAVGTTFHGYGTLVVRSFAGSTLSWNMCLKTERAWGRLLSRSYVTALGNCKGTKGRRWIFRILSFLYILIKKHPLYLFYTHGFQIRFYVTKQSHKQLSKKKKKKKTENPWCLLGFPDGASGKELTCQCRRQKRSGFYPWVGKIPWRRAWQPSAVFLPKKSHGQRSLAGYSPWGRKELDTTEVT